MEIKFERPISLVSLNIDLNFESVNSDAFFKQLQQYTQTIEESKG